VGLVTRQTSGDWITRSIAVADTARLTVATASGDAGNPTLDMADIAALSVWGRASGSSGKPAAIASSGDDTLVRRTAGAISFGQLTLAMAPNSLWTYAKIQDGSAVSVLGRSANSSGVLADIVAGANDRLLTRVSNAIAFTQLTAGMFPNTVVPDAALSSNVPLLNVNGQSFRVDTNAIFQTVFRNDDSGTAAQVYFVCFNGSSAVPFGMTGFNFSGTKLSGGPAGEVAFFYTNNTIPLVLGTNDAARLVIESGGTVALLARLRLFGYTVAALPAGTIGDTAYVTDATAPTYNGALTGGGAVTVPVFYNGAAWVSA